MRNLLSTRQAVNSLHYIAVVTFVFFSSTVFCQTYTHPTVGQQNTYVGSCPVAVCAGTYYDNGGAGSNYAANVNSILRTFHAATPGMCLRATFTSFSMNDTYFLCFGPNNCCDYLSILDGPLQSSPALYNNCTTSPGTITSTTGSLTFRFISDGSVQLAGWAATLSCVPCAAGQPATTSADCANHIPLYGNSNFFSSNTGPGLVAEGCTGCMLAEVYPTWYRMKIATSGTLAFTINPNQDVQDYDFALYGPNTGCGSLGTPIRCSAGAAAGNGNTGMGNGAADASEDILGDQWVSQLNVTAGQTFYLLVNAYQRTGAATNPDAGYSLSFTGTAALSSTLPVHLLNFSGNKQTGFNQVQWKAAEDGSTQQYELEKSYDGQVFSTIHTQSATGLSINEYSYNDHAAGNTKAYYRLKMTDRDGTYTYSQVIWIDQSTDQGITVYPNPVKDVVNIHTGDSRLLNSTVQLYDMQGKLLRTILLSTMQVQVNTGALSPGMYMLKFADGSRRSFIKSGE